MTHIARTEPDGSVSSSSAADAIIESVRRIAGDLAPLANDIDHKGIYPADFLRSLGEAGAYSPHLAVHTRVGTPDLGLAIRAMAEVGASCMSTAFCMWCQDACAWYLENTPNSALRDKLQPGIADGAHVVSGVLPWVSNLGDGHWFGTVFEDAADPAHKLMAMVRCGQPGVDIRQNARFIALEGTGTYSVLFRKAFIADDMLLADPLGDMVKRIKPGFILLQTGMGLGVVQAAIDLMHDANRSLGATNAYLPRQVGSFEDARAALLDTLMSLAATPLDGSIDYVRSVLTARLHCSELALEASQAALLHTGARGYIEGSAVSRVLRESYFVAIITPSIKHLRQELELLGRQSGG